MSTQAQRTAAANAVYAIIGHFANIPPEQVVGSMTLTDPSPEGYNFDSNALNGIYVGLNAYLASVGSRTPISSAEFARATYVGDLVGLAWDHLP
jgi:hypothetical protein